MRSSILNSPTACLISFVRRSSPYLSRSSVSSFLITPSIFFGEASRSSRFLMRSFFSLSSSSTRLRSRPASAWSRISRMAVACLSESLNFLISSRCASSLSADCLIVLMIASMWSRAFFRPSKICIRSLARVSSNCVRRATTLRRCSRKASKIIFRFSTRGSIPSTRASMLRWKVSCSCVCLKSWFRTLLGIASFFISTTMRTPSLSDSSRRFLIPSIFLSRTRSANFSSRVALFTR